jgi:class 3 adenylate cyclase
MTEAIQKNLPEGDAVKTRRRRFGTIPFAVALAASSGLLILIAVLAVLAMQWTVSRKNTFALLNEKVEFIMERIEFGVRDHLDPAREQTEFIAREIESGAVEMTDRSRLADLLTGSLAGVPQVAGIVVWNKNLDKLGVIREPDGSLGRIEGDSRGNPELMRAMAELTQETGTIWGEVVFDKGITYVNLRRPLRRDDELIGFLFTAIAVPELSQLVTRTGDLFNATAFVLHGRDHVLAHPYLVSAVSEQSEDDPLVALNRVGDLPLQELWKGRPVHGFDAAAQQDVEVVELSLGDQYYVAMYKWIYDYGEVPWVVGAWFAADDVGAEVRRLLRSGLAGLGVIVLAILAAVWLSRRIARPIRRLASGATLISELDLSHVEALPSSRVKELDEQARAFNSMLAGLRSFETYVPRTLVRQLVHRGSTEEVVSAERELSVMFTDVVGFTSMSEGRPARDVAQFLNHHFEMLGSRVEAEGGTVDKFIGDALMAFWGAPEPQSDTAQRACRAALDIARAIETDNDQRRAGGEDPIRIRIGLHTGPVVVGNVGWPGRINYTIVGDTVNTCQRLEAMGKEMDQGAAVTILISGATAARLDDGFTLERAGTFQVRGRNEDLEVFRLLG